MYSRIDLVSSYSIGHMLNVCSESDALTWSLFPVGPVKFRASVHVESSRTETLRSPPTQKGDRTGARLGAEGGVTAAQRDRMDDELAAVPAVTMEVDPEVTA